MPSVEVNDCHFNYEVHDFTPPWQPAETVWLQHGVGRNLRYWNPCIPLLGEDYRVVTRDMRGHGGSCDPGPAWAWSLDKLLDDMVGFMDANDLRATHYIGESLGGALGILLAARHPERVKTLTIISTPIALNRTKSGFPNMSTEERNRQIADGRIMIDRKVIWASSPAHADWVVQEWKRTPKHVLAGIMEMNGNGIDLEPVLKEITAPTLILASANSTITPLIDQITLRNAISNAQLAVVESPTHEIHTVKPRECMAAWRRFVGSLVAPGANTTADGRSSEGKE